MKYFIRLFLFCVMLCGTRHSLDAGTKPAPQHELSICAIFQNEAPYLREWIEFHLQVGVDHFYLYNNLSQDNFKEVLEPYIEEGIVELVDWSFKITGDLQWCKIQYTAYNHVLANKAKQSRWIAFIDIDEFIVPTQGDNILEVLDDFEEYGGLGVNWQLYGTSHIAKIPDNMLLIEALLYKADENDASNLHVKSIVNPKRVNTFPSAHFAYYKDGYYCVNENHERVEGPKTAKVSVQRLRINHYWTRDEDYFYNVKIASRQRRGWPVEKDLESAKRLNECYDPIMLNFVPQMRDNMGY